MFIRSNPARMILFGSGLAVALSASPALAQHHGEHHDAPVYHGGGGHGGVSFSLGLFGHDHHDYYVPPPVYIHDHHDYYVPPPQVVYQDYYAPPPQVVYAPAPSHCDQPRVVYTEPRVVYVPAPAAPQPTYAQSAPIQAAPQPPAPPQDIYYRQPDGTIMRIPAGTVIQSAPPAAPHYQQAPPQEPLAPQGQPGASPQSPGASPQSYAPAGARATSLAAAPSRVNPGAALVLPRPSTTTTALAAAPALPAPSAAATETKKEAPHTHQHN